MSVKLSSSNHDDLINKDKIKNLKIHVDEINKIVNKKNIIHKKIQLWTNNKHIAYSLPLSLVQSWIFL